MQVSFQAKLNYQINFTPKCAFRENLTYSFQVGLLKYKNNFNPLCAMNVWEKTIQEEE